MVWQKNRFLTYALPIFYIFVWGGAFATVGIFLRSLRCQYSIFSAHFLISGLSLYSLYYFLVEPNARNPYIGCYATRYNPIILLCWVLLLLYDKGTAVNYYQFGVLKICICVLVMLILMIIAAFRARVCELVLRLIRIYDFSEIIQTARQVKCLSWKLYTEMASRFIHSSALYILKDWIGVLYYFYLYGTFM